MCRDCSCGLVESEVSALQAGSVVAASGASVPADAEAGASHPLATAPSALAARTEAPPAPSTLSPASPTLTSVELGRRLLERNELQALANRHRLVAAGVRAVNLLSSPGSGKTALLEALARQAAGHAAATTPADRSAVASAPSVSPASATFIASATATATSTSIASATSISSSTASATAHVSAGAPEPPASGRSPRLAALVGDLATDLDARRLESAGLRSVAINTGQACHLDAAMVCRGLDALEARGAALESLDLLLIENVGNLVCPAAYDLGESLRLVLLAVGEGEDKPLKYPATFHSADLVLISKVDLAEAVGFDRPQALANIASVAPRAAVLEVSARSGAGVADLLEWLLAPRP